MARSDKNGMIDGYMAVQSVRRKTGHQADEPSAAGTAPHGAQQAPKDVAAGGREDRSAATVARPAPFGQTALPTRHDISCYGCGYHFVVTGRLDRVICPKCKTELTTGDKTICGPFSGTIETVGTVTIHAGAKVTDSRITASVIRIAGQCEGTQLCPGQRVELETGAALDTARLGEVDVLVARKAEVQLQDDLHCRSLRIEGTLTAQVRTQGLVVLQAGARFRGKLEAAGLVVADGAGLQGELAIRPLAGAGNSESTG